ncbi:MAG: response regulator [Nitrospirota bacterium]
MKILIAEDNEKNRKLIQVILEKAGYDAIEAENGEDAICLAKKIIPDLILMDIQMPVMDGIEAIKILKSDSETKDIPVIALTSYAMAGDRERLLNEGFNGYIPKPINVKNFIKEVKKYIKP